MAIRIGNKEFSPEAVQDMIDAGLLGAGAKHDVSSTTPTATPLVGPFPGNNNQYGPLGATGYQARPGLWNATARVRSFANLIPLFASRFKDQVLDVATGVTAGSGNNVTGACAVGPKPGQLKAARITIPFGIFHLSTKIADLTQAGSLRHYGDEGERQFFNNAASSNPWLPQVPGIDGSDGYSSLLRTEMLAFGTEAERNIGQVNVVGVSGTEDNTYRGVARQWNGLDRLIRTGWTDIDGSAAPALDAEIQNFGANIDGGSDTNSRTIVGALIDTYYGQRDFLRRLGISADFVLVMRPDLFRALAAVWSCLFQTTRCTTSQNGALQLSGEAIYQQYLAMMNGMYLPMEGENVPVVVDDTIPRLTLGNNYYKSKVYGVALRGNGRPVVYGEYFPMNNPEAVELEQFVAPGVSTTVNNGLYRVSKFQTGACVEFDFYAKLRLITDAPFMHFSLDNVFYRSAYDQRDALPGQSHYVNGGATHRL